MGNKKPNSVKNMMYEQQVRHLPKDLTVANIFDEVGKRLSPDRYAVILHDKDTSADGSPAEANVHVMMTFKNARSLNNIAKLLGDKPQYVQKWDERAGNGFAYLVHHTTSSVGKHQYDVSEVRANFDFPALIAKMDASAAKAKKSIRVDELLDALKNGTIEKAEVERLLSGSLYAKIQPQIERVSALCLKERAEKWRIEAVKSGKTIQLIWIYGAAGTGKTSLAKSFSANRNEPYFISGSSRDIFQKYNGEHTIILDELRPNVIPYADLLRLTDPYSIANETMAPSRYADKSLACNLFVVTSPYSPKQFYDCYGNGNQDSFMQLERRIAVTIKMDDDYISRAEWSDSQQDYITLTASQAANKFSTKNRPVTPNSAESLFEQIVGS